MTKSKIIKGFKDVAFGGETAGSRVTVLKTKGDYSEHVITKMIDGKPEEVVDIDSMTEDQFKQFCRNTGTKWFQRLSVNI
jgi:hypothetical protein